ncbi:hypothetical protein PC114_g12079 [Phytophthora cactorum]|uniref:Uncharacterized protein n=2 Tax=Phytophthora cactorum TaxID=29920 RepID=A0A8T1CJP5_9STRA|nr:hypothetical protein PC114_g12079 [Phytophthora cactorum]KAG2921040.1 hypothetical protein PC117_g16348 [Phytophthora cactorum]
MPNEPSTQMNGSTPSVSVPRICDDELTTALEKPTRSTTCTSKSTKSRSMPLQSLTGRKRRTSDESAPQQTPVRRRRVSNTCRVQHCQDTNQVQKFRETGDGKCGNQGKPGNFSLSSPTDVSDAVVVQQIRAKQAKASGLPNLSLSLLAKSIVAKIEEASELKGEVEAEALTPRPTVRRHTAPRPPLSRRRAIGLNRARFGVGIVRCRIWKLNEEDTETEDESPESSPRRENPSSSKATKLLIGADFGYSDDDNSEKLEDQVGALVLPIDPTQACFDRSFSEDQWQLRSPSPDEKFVPENSCCAATSVEKTVKDECGSGMRKPTPIHAAHVESN